MRFHILAVSLMTLVTGSAAQLDIRSSVNGSVHSMPTSLNITALTGRNDVSVLECWQLTQKLAPSTLPGRIGSYALPFGNAENTSYGVIPSNFLGGLHNAPRKQ